MKRHIGVRALLGSAMVLAMSVIGGVLTGAQAPLAIDSARITINGTSNIHAYTASTTTVRVTRAQLASGLEGERAETRRPRNVSSHDSGGDAHVPEGRTRRKHAQGSEGQ